MRLTDGYFITELTCIRLLLHLTFIRHFRVHVNIFIAESVSFKVDKSGNGGSGSSGHGGSGNRDLGPEYRMPPRLEMLLDMPPVALEEQIKHAWNTEDR